MMTNCISAKRLQVVFYLFTVGFLAVVLSSSTTQAAPQHGPRMLQPLEPELAALKKKTLTRPTRPAKVEPNEPIVGSEIFTERFADGTVKVEREVTLDAEGNYVNHGPWRMWNQAGKLLAEGSFDHGQRASVWTRWYDRADSPMFNQPPFRRFKAPFLSQVNFENGIINGDWSIFDAQQNRCCQISMSQGKRNGMTLFWLADGSVLQQSMYDQGVPTGDVLQLDTKTGKLVQSKNFLNGREKITKKSSHRRGNQVKFEGHFLAPTSVLTKADDFWNLQFAKYEPQGEELRHGQWQEWYPNGQQKMSGQYNHSKMVGQFSYWHPNGQKAAEGNYAADKHDNTWVWWHRNGQKSVSGSFQKGQLVDQWRWWAEDGKLAKQMIHDGTQSFEALAKEKSVEKSVEKNESARTSGRVQR